MFDKIHIFKKKYFSQNSHFQSPIFIKFTYPKILIFDKIQTIHIFQIFRDFLDKKIGFCSSVQQILFCTVKKRNVPDSFSWIHYWLSSSGFLQCLPSLTEWQPLSLRYHLPPNHSYHSPQWPSFYSPRWSGKNCRWSFWTYPPRKHRSKSYNWHWLLTVNGWRRRNSDTKPVEKTLKKFVKLLKDNVYKTEN